VVREAGTHVRIPSLQIAPTIALVPIILGIYAIFNAVYNYTSDSYGELSSSAIAGQGVNSVSRFLAQAANR
jgi:hypothetical protein